MERLDQPLSRQSITLSALEPDHVLASRALHDRAAFAELYQRYLTPVYGYCFRRLGSREAAEDATSQVFTKALEGLSGVRTPNIRAWLFTIAHNVVVDSYKRQRGDLNLALAEEIASPERPDEVALLGLDLAALHQALDLLTPDQRQVVELRLAGLTGPEIREVMGRSRSWVDTTQYRAIQKLRGLMAPELEDSHVL